MKLKTVPFSKLLAQSEDTYSSVIVSAKRSKQIVDSRVVKLDPVEAVSDDEYFTGEVSLREDFVEHEKPIVVALEEFVDGKLEWTDGKKIEDKTE
ncbi:MAG: DNA-directed RNA polymerase subunit omega [Candidatus Marinimicrobia bacterium]|nr:DNA-directed RNA polymerase subunit omega [Candidatus Neomarinimicrobiota bacterium]MBL7023256.1 DNA-directed RNA polymerase subunit omega [Candidatus Neomarinimicrobiota bacterium]MBL7108850.1 DNA-directed RNA polymerase subunit omega [Candidatus Neomarinimicrobiota bacterium]